MHRPLVEGTHRVRVLIVGFGNIGRRHLRNLRTLMPSAVVAVCRQRREPVDGTPDTAEVFHDIDEAVAWKPDAAIVASPAPLHVPHGLALADAGVDLLVEKPMSHTQAGVQSLVERCHERRVVLMVGYNLRFDRSLEAVRRAVHDNSIGRVVSIRAEVGQFLPDWRPQIDYRRTVSAQKALGGGAALELSHEFDYVRWIAGEPISVAGCVAVSGHLDLDCEDSADVLLSFANGAIGNVHVDFLDRSAIRRCRIVGTEGTITWDGIGQQAARFAPAEGWVPLSNGGERTDTYTRELEHFLDCVQSRRQPLVTGEDGAKALAIALAAKASSETGSRITL
jgi:predicted dehydrogenase